MKGIDKEMEMKEGMLPEVTVICLDCTEEEIEQKRREISYEKVRIERVSLRQEGLKGVFRVILDTESPYICFAESGRISSADKIGKMVAFLEKEKGAGSVLCWNEYIGENGEHIGWTRKIWIQYLKEYNLVNGNAFLELCLLQEDNIYGNLESCMLRRETFINKEFLLNYFDCGREEEKLILMFECLYGMAIGIVKEILVKSVEKKLDIEASYEQEGNCKKLRDKILQQVYKKSGYSARKLPSIYRAYMEETDRRSMVGKVEKRITFFHCGKTESYSLEPIAEEAQRRGFEVSFSQNLGEKAEIGVYCSHVGVIQRAEYSAKFSVILLHDMTQGDLDWPDLWNDEPWNEFDLGILPGHTWAERWQKSSGFFWAHPRLGVYEAGYPKGDYAHSIKRMERSKEIRKKLNLKYKYSILYAPAWENDGKEDDFVKALCGLPVNLLIKQGAWTQYMPVVNSIKQMREMHDGKYENVYYIDATENIMNIYPFCDLVVSDESGAMTEALLFQKPSVAVLDWEIPDQVPPRLAHVSVDYVYKCKKAELKETVEAVLDKIRNKMETKGIEPFFSHIGESSAIIMDLIEYYIGTKEEDSCLSTEILPIHRLHGLWD